MVGIVCKNELSQLNGYAVDCNLSYLNIADVGENQFRLFPVEHDID